MRLLLDDRQTDPHRRRKAEVEGVGCRLRLEVEGEEKVDDFVLRCC